MKNQTDRTGRLETPIVNQDDELEFIRSPGSQTSSIDEDEEGDGDGNLVLLHHNSIVVTKKNKIICVTGFIILILSMLGYLLPLAYFHTKYNDIASHDHFFTAMIGTYVILGCDIIASCVGIWACITKTGPYPMIYSCIWMLISALLNLAELSTLTYDSKEYKTDKAKHCSNGTKNDKCIAYGFFSTYLWCSALFLILKITVIVLCRLNYPQVFNWLLGKQILVDEKIVNVDMKSLTHIGALGAGYFDPCDIERLMARGSIGGTILESGASNTIIVAKKDSGVGSGSEIDIQNQDAQREKRKSSVRTARRATLVSISPR